MAVHGVQLRCWQTRHDPWVNLLRSTLACFVGAAGGADAITLLPYDEPGAGRSSLGQRMATNTQLLLAEESHLGVVRDPAAGSYTVEHLTVELARAGWAVMQSIEAAGGLETEAGRTVLVTRVAQERAAMATDIDRRKASLVGVSEFPGAMDQVLAPGPDSASAGRLAPIRHAAVWEDLRDAAEARPDLPPVFLATWGPLVRHSARAMFTTNLLLAGGLRSVDPGGATEVAPLIAAFQQSGARACVICGSDADYPDAVPALAAGLRAAGAEAIWVAGRPPADPSTWEAAGVSDFVYTGCNARTRLAALHRLLDIPSAE
jgi:methylmalonyl-CoA mutase